MSILRPHLLRPHLLALFLSLPLARAADLSVTLPDSIHPKSAAALAPSQQPAEEGPSVRAEIHGQTIQFNSLKPLTPYDLKISLDNGLVLYGVNMAWYSREPVNPTAPPLNDDDRRQIGALVSNVKSFYDISRVITLAGDHDRATVLVERIRSSAFHSGAPGQTIWRVELWYFVNDFGGWNERPQTNKVLRRQRFASDADYQQAVTPIRWIPMLGGIVLDTAAQTRHIFLPPGTVSATRPASTTSP